MANKGRNQLRRDFAQRDATVMIVREGLAALAAAVATIDRLEALLPEMPADGYVIVSDPELPEVLLLACIYIGTAWKALFDAGVGETENWLKRAKKARHDWVAGLLAGIDISPLSGLDIRNKMVHVEDHMLKVERRVQGPWTMSLGLSHREAFNTSADLQMKYCRVFIFSEGVLLHLGSEFNLYQYRDTAKAVIERLMVPCSASA